MTYEESNEIRTISIIQVEFFPPEIQGIKLFILFIIQNRIKGAKVGK